MRGCAGSAGWLFWAAVLGLGAWLLGLGDLARESIRAGRLADWVFGGLCLAWLLVVLKVPWDLYFQAQQALFELDRSREHRIPVPAGRVEYLRRLKRRLGWLAVGVHAASAALAAGIGAVMGSLAGFWFAAVFAVSAAFRPAAAGYAYLSYKLRALAEESRYPREDVLELRERVRLLEQAGLEAGRRLDQHHQCLQEERAEREAAERELRQRIGAVARELEVTVNRLTDNQEVIRGIQAFVRLVSQASSP